MDHGHAQERINQNQNRETTSGMHETPRVGLRHDNNQAMANVSTTTVLRLMTALCLVGCRAANSEESTPLNVIVVSIDTLRGDRVGRAGPNGESLTPVLDAFAQDSTQFTAAFSQSNETLFSHASMFTGRYPSELGPMDYMTYRIAPGTSTIASRLGDAGYRTEAVVGGGHMAPAFGMQAGFHRYRSTSDFSGFQETMPLALETLDDLAREDSPFFLFVHGYDCHTPYIKPGPFGRAMSPGHESDMVDLARQPLTYDRIHKDKYYPEYEAPQISSPDALRFLDPEMFSDLKAYAEGPGESNHKQLSNKERRFLIGTYDSATQYADTHVGFLLDRIDALSLRENTVVIVLSDHGEDLLDNGYFNHRVSLHDSNLRVPLIIRAPGVEPSVRRDLVGLIDLLPTVLDITGLPPIPGRGQNLLEPPRSEDRAIYSESLRGHTSIRTSRGRLISATSERPPSIIPETAPDNFDLYHPNGRAQRWNPRKVADLWIALRKVERE